MSYTGYDAADSLSGGSETDTAQLIGLTLGDALKIVLDKGYSVENISITAPPRLNISEYDNSFRVLRITHSGDKRLSILVCKPL